MLSTHSQRLERYIGAEQAEIISAKMRGFHAPIRVANVPGRVFAQPDGDFAGEIVGGSEASFAQRLHDVARRELKLQRIRMAARNKQWGGFSGLSDLISEATAGGKSQRFIVGKTGVTGVANVANSLWDVGAQPAAGAVTAATEVIPTNTTTGGLGQANAGAGDTLHYISSKISGTVANNCLLMFDLFQYYTHNIATQNISSLGASVTRYQSTAAKGSFLTAFVTSVLGGTVGTYQLTYQDQDGNTAETNTAQSLVATAIARRFPFAATVGNGWFLPINAADSGIRKFTAITQSVATGTGNIMVAACMPLVWLPIPIANVPIIDNGIQDAFNPVQIVDNACLAFMEINKGATTATSYSGTITLVSG